MTGESDVPGAPTPDPSADDTGTDAAATPSAAGDPLRRAAAEAERAAREAQRQAETARRLADEYARLAAQAAAPHTSDEDDATETGAATDAAASTDTPTATENATDDDAAQETSAGISLAKPSDEAIERAVGATTGTDRAAEDEVTDDADADTTSGTAKSRTPLLVAGVAMVACLAFAVAMLALYLTSSGSGGSGEAAVRDQVLLEARQDIIVLNTLDYRDVEAGLKRWSDASTGTLHQQLQHVTDATRKQILSAKSITTATVLDAAVTSLDPSDGSATVIASIELRVAPQGTKAQVKRERLQADLTRVDGSWKVGSLQQVGVTVQ